MMYHCNLDFRNELLYKKIGFKMDLYIKYLFQSGLKKGSNRKGDGSKEMCSQSSLHSPLDAGGLILMDESVVDVGDEGAKTLAALERASVQRPQSASLEALLANLGSMPSYVLIPEQERGLIVGRVANALLAQLSSYVSSGGVLVVAYAGGYASLFSSLFSWSLSQQGCSSTSLDPAEAAGTAFASGPGSLPYLNAVVCVASNSLPPGSRAVYRDGGGAVSVFVAPHGRGAVVGLAPDWFSSSSEWDTVLARAVSISANVTRPG